jgi:heme/copper-type cytochrome/quinol oxidase subunit 2
MAERPESVWSLIVALLFAVLSFVGAISTFTAPVGETAGEKFAYNLFFFPVVCISTCLGILSAISLRHFRAQNKGVPNLRNDLASLGVLLFLLPISLVVLLAVMAFVLLWVGLAYTIFVSAAK